MVLGGSYPGVRYGQQPDVGGLDAIEIIDRSAGADECHGGARARDVTIVDLPHVDDTVRDDQVAERLADAAGTHDGQSGHGDSPATVRTTVAAWRRGGDQSCLIAMVFSAVKPSNASKPFSRPYPLAFTPPNGSSTPPPAP